MALKTAGAFAAGVVVGWVGRSMVGSTRDALVRTLVVGQRLRERVRRLVAEQAEWLEDVWAEGHARYEEAAEPVPVDDRKPPRVSFEPAEPPRARGEHAA